MPFHAPPSTSASRSRQRNHGLLVWSFRKILCVLAFLATSAEVLGPNRASTGRLPLRPNLYRRINGGSPRYGSCQEGRKSNQLVGSVNRNRSASGWHVADDPLLHPAGVAERSHSSNSLPILAEREAGRPYSPALPDERQSGSPRIWVIRPRVAGPGGGSERLIAMVPDPLCGGIAQCALVGLLRPSGESPPPGPGRGLHQALPTPSNGRMREV